MMFVTIGDTPLKLAEATALQLVFDVKFLFAVIRLPSSDASCRYNNRT
jgi:hypothetical protein